MAVDGFTEGLRVVSFVLLGAAGVYLCGIGIRRLLRSPERSDGQRLYDWQFDGECSNESKPRLLP
jgi:hypothetical protein